MEMNLYEFIIWFAIGATLSFIFGPILGILLGVTLVIVFCILENRGYINRKK